MIKKIYHFFTNIGDNIKLFIVTKYINKSVTLVGPHQAYRSVSSVSLCDGATRKNIVLHEHCDMFGEIRVHSTGVVVMHPWSKLARGSTIVCVNRVEIGRDTAISYGVEIIDNNNHPTNPDDRRYMRHTPHGSEERKPKYSANAPIIIGENVLIGSYSRIQKGVSIGDNSIVASHSVVTHDVPANCIVAGNPAKVVKTDIDKTTTPIFPLQELDLSM